ncbi:MAG: hypothetical protein HFH32_01275 [Eubacterium sp.]|jgi:hypothetical protein|nr:hypothetical protein [Eubacterium sp.]
MDRQDSWKRTEEMEIDLADLFRRLCRQWKQIMACAAVCAVIAGGYGWIMGSPAEEISGGKVQEELTEAEEQAVMDAVRLEAETGELETYLQNSVLMHADPYEKHKYVMLYSIDRADRQELAKITESYLNFIINGGAADMLEDSGKNRKLEKRYLAEIVSAYQKIYSSPYLITVDGDAQENMFSESLFYVEVTGRDEKEARELAQDMQAVIKQYSPEAAKHAGKHRLELAGSMHSVTADSGLLAQQREKKQLLSSNRTNLRTIVDAFNEAQLQAYQEAAGLEEGHGKEEILQEISDGNARSLKKYIFLGFAGGIMAYAGIFSCCYLLRDTVKSLDEMKRLYTFPVFGGIPFEKGKRKHGSTEPEMRQEASEREKARVLNRIRIACGRKGIKRLYAVSDFELSGREKVFLDSMAMQLKEWGIDMTVAENTAADAVLWDNIAEAGNVLMVCRIGTTTHRMADDAMRFYLENGIAVAGAAVFLQGANGWR